MALPIELSDMSPSELRTLIVEAQRRLVGGGQRSVGVKFRTSSDDGVSVTLLDSSEYQLAKDTELHLPVTSLPIPDASPGSALGARTSLTTARSLLGGRVRSTKAATLLLAFEELRRNSAAHGWPIVLLLDAEPHDPDLRGPAWRATMSSPATLAVHPDMDAVFLILGMGTAVDAAAIGKALLSVGDEEPV